MIAPHRVEIAVPVQFPTKTANFRLFPETEQGPQSLVQRLRAWVFRPVARSVYRMSLSSITMLVRMEVYSIYELYTSIAWTF